MTTISKLRMALPLWGAIFFGGVFGNTGPSWVLSICVVVLTFSSLAIILYSQKKQDYSMLLIAVVGSIFLFPLGILCGYLMWSKSKIKRHTQGWDSTPVTAFSTSQIYNWIYHAQGELTQADDTSTATTTGVGSVFLTKMTMEKTWTHSKQC